MLINPLRRRMRKCACHRKDNDPVPKLSVRSFRQSSSQSQHRFFCGVSGTSPRLFPSSSWSPNSNIFLMDRTLRMLCKIFFSIYHVLIIREIFAWESDYYLIIFHYLICILTIYTFFFFYYIFISIFIINIYFIITYA